MPDKKSKAVRALQALGRRAQQGWAQLEPVSEQHLAMVRAAVHQQWEAKQRTQAQAEGSQAVSSTLKESRVQSQNKAKTQDKSHKQSSGQSHSESESQIQAEDHEQSKDHGHSY
jgi:hypothetical protein